MPDEKWARMVEVLVYTTERERDDDAKMDAKVVSASRTGTFVHTVEDVNILSGCSGFVAYQKTSLLGGKRTWCSREEAIAYLNE